MYLYSVSSLVFMMMDLNPIQVISLSGVQLSGDSYFIVSLTGIKQLLKETVIPYEPKCRVSSICTQKKRSFWTKVWGKSSSQDTSCNQMEGTESKERSCLSRLCILLWEVGTQATWWEVQDPLRFFETALSAAAVIVHIPCLSLLHFHIF